MYPSVLNIIIHWVGYCESILAWNMSFKKQEHQDLNKWFALKSVHTCKVKKLKVRQHESNLRLSARAISPLLYVLIMRY